MNRRIVALFIFALAMLGLAATYRGSIRTVEAYPGADNIALTTQACNPDGTVRINLAWTAYSIGVQWIDLSHANNGFQFGTFVGAGPFLPWENSWTPWYGIGGGRAAYMRINTFDGFTWHPSQTISFFTRGDCQVSADLDQDGLPVPQDACPTVFGVSWANGCAQQPPFGGTDTVATWTPGQNPPESRCTPPGAGCVWPTKGNGATYTAGEIVRVCYWVPAPTNVYIDTVRPDGSTIATLLLQATGSPSGNCFNTDVVASPPTGTRTLRLFTGPSMVQLTQVDTSTWLTQ